MSTHPSLMACHQPAPIPNMEVQSSIPAKRGPEDDVQFVSVQPVKKACGSRESPPAQIQQTPDQCNAHPQGQTQGIQAHDTYSSNTVAASGPQPEPYMLNRGVSFPGLENYVFPPPPNSKPSRTSCSSPVLSPRQLPQPVLPNQMQNSMQAPQGFRGLVAPPQFQVPWGMSALYPQAGPTNPDVPTSRSKPSPHVQPQSSGADSVVDIDDQPLSMSMALRNPEPPRTPNQVSQPESQRRMPQSGHVPEAQAGPSSKPEEKAKTIKAPSNQADHGSATALPLSSPRQEPQSQVDTPSHVPAASPMPAATEPRVQSSVTFSISDHNAMARSQGSTAQQATPPKGPCVTCEQMRQQVLFNQANGLPITHLPQIPHGWHGQGPVPQMQMGHPNAGYGMVPSMLQNLQPRFQPFSLGHLPMGYGMQPIPVQVQMQMQRQLQAPNVTENEPSQGISTQSQQGQQTQGQQTTGQICQFIPGQPTQYITGQLSSAPQPVMMQRSMMMHQQALAPPAPPPSPKPSQPAPNSETTLPTQAPALPDPKVHSPNLIVDIAETCEALFPWDEVAKRHGVTRVKVVETFGAVIQLPLLRCTTDKKRHGKLATSRLREYTKAKKDAEAANAASTAKATPAASTPPTSAAPVAPSKVAQVPETQMTAHQAQSQTSQAQAMQAQANQMFANQGHSNPNHFPPPHGQVYANQVTNTPSGAFEMPNTMSPLGLPSNLTNGLSGHWQRQ